MAKLSRKKRKERAEKKRKDLQAKILQHFKDTIKLFSSDGQLNTRDWFEDADRYVAGLIKASPQDGELIRSAAIQTGQMLKIMFDEGAKMYKNAKHDLLKE